MSERATFNAAVFIIIRDDANRILLHRRSNTGFMDGYYDFPSGHVDIGESFMEAAVRELTEETNLVIEQSDLLLKHVNQNFLDTAYINVMFEVVNWTGIPTIMEPNKCDDMQFFAIDALPEKCTLAVRCIEKYGFDTHLTMSKITKTDYAKLIGRSYDPISK